MKDNRKIFEIDTPAAEGNKFDWTNFKNRLDKKEYLFQVDFSKVEQVGNCEKDNLLATHKACPYCQGSAFEKTGVLRGVTCSNCKLEFSVI